MGGVRTALYNYLFAKKHGGDFLLRIEDTDQGRFVPGAEDYIIESLKWCGISPNEGVGFGDGPYAPYRQSERKAIYKQYAEQLVNSGHAYYAFDSQEEIEKARKQAEEKKLTFSYDQQTRLQMRNSLSLSKSEVEDMVIGGVPHVIRLKVPASEEIHLHDMIRGEVAFKSELVDDKVLLKSDGMPTYHLAHIVDDYLMQITHVIRGEEWLPSAPAHVLIYRYLGWNAHMPKFAHLPLLLKPDGNGKLSKRDGDRLGFPVFPLDWIDPVTKEHSSGYRERGYYPQAFINMLALLGWNPGTEAEIFTTDEAAIQFSFEHIHKSGARFDPEKARWFNEEYLRQQPINAIANRIRPKVAERFAIQEDDRRLSDSFLNTVVELMKPRIQFEAEILNKGNYLFVVPAEYDKDVIVKKWKDVFGEFFKTFSEKLNSINTWDAASIESILKSTAVEAGIKPGELLQLFRVMISGQSGGVDLFGMCALLGREELQLRIDLALQNIASKSN